MKRWILAIGLIFIFFGAVLWLRSTMAEQKSSTIWEEVKTAYSTLEISANLTAGDKVKLTLSPSRDWRSEPATDEVPYPHTFIWLNVTSPTGDRSSYEITYAQSYIYSVHLLIAGGFSGEYDDETLQTEKAVIGKVKYDGLYQAKITGIMPPGGTPAADALTFLEETETTTIEHPYAGCIYAASSMFIVGIVVAAFSFRASRQKTQGKRKARKIRQLHANDSSSRNGSWIASMVRFLC
jgi:hypothetical protein